MDKYIIWNVISIVWGFVCLVLWCWCFLFVVFVMWSVLKHFGEPIPVQVLNPTDYLVHNCSVTVGSKYYLCPK